MSFERRAPRLGWRTWAAAAVMTLAVPVAASAAGDGGFDTPHQKWSFAGFFGHYDQAQLQRGFQVYKEVCANCHNLRLVKYRNLGDAGGPGFSEAVVKELAKASEFPEIDENGKVKPRQGRPQDPIMLAPYKNEQEARATYNGALPPDLSVIAKARSSITNLAWFQEPFKWVREIATGYQEGGADYLHALLMGYSEVPSYTPGPSNTFKPVPPGQKVAGAVQCVVIEVEADSKKESCVKLQEGMNYNKYFPGHQIAMVPPPMDDKLVKYTDGAPQTRDQYARDVTAFLMWTAEPKLNDRKRMGLQVLLYLGITALLLYLAKRRLWAKIEH